MLDYNLRKSVVGKVNLSDQLNIEYGKHRSGWQYAIESLKALHNDDGYLLDSFIEKTFTWNPEQIGIKKRPWIGIIHIPPNVPNWFLSNQSNNSIFNLKEWKKSLELCVGLFTLSNYHKKNLQSKLSIPVESLIHPTMTPETKWDWDKFISNDKKKIVQIGWWLRKLHAIYQLELKGYKKFIIKPDHLDFFDELFLKEQKILQEKENFSTSLYDTVKTLPFLSNSNYDLLLNESVVFMNLYDTSANNLIIECIVRNTPILVNPLPAVIEYLGEDYPLFYNTLEEAEDKAENFELIYQAHNYLKNSNKVKLTGNYFFNSFIKSNIYSNLESDLGQYFNLLKSKKIFFEKEYQKIQAGVSNKDKDIAELKRQNFDKKIVLDKKEAIIDAIESKNIKFLKDIEFLNNKIKIKNEKIALQNKLLNSNTIEINNKNNEIRIKESEIYKKEIALQEANAVYLRELNYLNSFILSILRSRVFKFSKIISNFIKKFRDKKDNIVNTKKKVAFIDHSFHKKSLATEFLIYILKQKYDVQVFWDESWNKGTKVSVYKLKQENFDIIVFFQSYNYFKEELRLLSDKKIVLIPMYDGAAHFDFNFWQKYKKAKIINFSNNLNNKLENFGLDSKYFQYFPDISKFKCKKKSNKLIGFFWQRTEFINWNTIKKLIGNNRFEYIYINCEIDPQVNKFVRPSEKDIEKYNIKIINWQKSREEYFRILKKCNVFFAPRLYEGIGMSFLEAMAMGICVIAPDHPTMNEYIKHEENGLLYNPRKIKKLDFTNINQLGIKAGESIETGHKKWQDNKMKLIDFIESKNKNNNYKIFLNGIKSKIQNLRSTK